jgi:hypothetical protein
MPNGQDVRRYDCVCVSSVLLTKASNDHSSNVNASSPRQDGLERKHHEDCYQLRKPWDNIVD